MPQCAEILEMLSGYLDRDLPAETCREIEAHLESCSSCGQEAEALRRTVALCREYRGGTLPGPLAECRQEELRAAFARVLERMRGSS